MNAKKVTRNNKCSIKCHINSGKHLASIFTGSHRGKSARATSKVSVFWKVTSLLSFHCFNFLYLFACLLVCNIDSVISLIPFVFSPLLLFGSFLLLFFANSSKTFSFVIITFFFFCLMLRSFLLFFLPFLSHFLVYLFVRWLLTMICFSKLYMLLLW